MDGTMNRMVESSVGAKAPRFLTLTDVAEVLNTSSAQVYALVRRGDLVAIKIGGRGQWRVEATELEAYIQRMYAEARTFIDEHPFEDSDVEPADPEAESAPRS
jgi:excisionase family DNA binding protein